jgi:hypothetical protein
MSIKRTRRLTALVALSLLGASFTFQGQDKKLTAREAKYHIGEQATVCGKVASGRHTRARGNPTFLDLDKAYPNQPFTVLIWGRDRAKFRNPEETYRNKNICVTGRIGSDRDEPEMIISDPTQLTANIEKAEKLQEVWPRYRKPITKAALRRCDSCAVAPAFSRAPLSAS